MTKWIGIISFFIPCSLLHLITYIRHSSLAVNHIQIYITWTKIIIKSNYQKVISELKLEPEVKEMRIVKKLTKL